MCRKLRTGNWVYSVQHSPPLCSLSIYLSQWYGTSDIAAYTSLCTSTQLKDGIFCRNRHYHGGFVKTGFFQKTASSCGKTEFFPELFITWQTRLTPFKRGFKPRFSQKQASLFFKTTGSGLLWCVDRIGKRTLCAPLLPTHGKKKKSVNHKLVCGRRTEIFFAAPINARKAWACIHTTDA